MIINVENSTIAVFGEYRMLNSIEKHFSGELIHLSAWNSYFCRELSIYLNIGGDMPNVQSTAVVTSVMNNLIENQDEIIQTIVERLYSLYPLEREAYDYDEEIVPNVLSIAQYKELINPVKIIALPVNVKNVYYMGIEFSCLWDEHGIGVMIYGKRIVEVGGADVASLNWIAQKDKASISLD